MQFSHVITATIVTFLSLNSAFSAICGTPATVLNSNLDRFINHKIPLPQLLVKSEKSITLSEEILPKEMTLVFGKAQALLYGRSDFISMRACQGCMALADAKSKSVYIEGDFLRTVTSDFPESAAAIMAFIAAHELSHFTLEFMTLDSPQGLSPNGNIPLLTKSGEDFIDFGKFANLSVDEQQKEIKKYADRASSSHAEVDILALLTLAKIGWDVYAPVINYLEKQIANPTMSELAKADFRVRKNALVEAFGAGSCLASL